MHVSRSGSQRCHRGTRPALAAILMLAISAVAGAVNAFEFDQSFKDPRMRTAAELLPQAKDFVTTYRQAYAATPAQLINNSSLARRQFDMRWQLQRAVDEGRPLVEFADMGLVSRGDGSYTIDIKAHPEWGDLSRDIVGLMAPDGVGTTSLMLVEAGFRPEDVATLKNYAESHDAAAAARMAALPITLGFIRVVKKLDKAKRPVPDTLVTSFFYQRTLAMSESNRLWVAELFRQFDAQRVRIMLSTFLELGTVGYWIPEKTNIAIAATLSNVRLPNVEELARAEAEGVTP